MCSSIVNKKLFVQDMFLVYTKIKHNNIMRRTFTIQELRSILKYRII